VLPKEIFSKATYADLEEHVMNIQKVRELSELEDLAVKRQKRMIKNRDYSSVSRQKVKLQIQELTIENNKLKQEKDLLTQSVSILQRENSRLLLENSQYRATLNGLGFTPQGILPNPNNNFPQNTSVGFNLPGMNSIANNQKFTTINLNGQNESNAQYFNYIQPKSNPLKSNAAITTLCLFVILFSFGLFFGPNLFPSTGLDQIRGSSRALFASSPITTGVNMNEMPRPFTSIETKTTKFRDFADTSHARRGNAFSWGFGVYSRNVTADNIDSIPDNPPLRL